MDMVLVYVRGPRGGRIVSVAPGGIVGLKADEYVEIVKEPETPSALRYREIGRIESVDHDTETFTVWVYDHVGTPDVGETVWVREP